VSTTRREAIIAAGAGIAGLALHPAHVLSSEPQMPLQPHQSMLSAHDHDLLKSLLKFRKDVQRLTPEDRKGTKAISIPFATQPINVYMRSPEYLKDKVKAPDLSELRASINRHQWDPSGIAHVAQELDQLTKHLWETVAPKHWKKVDECTAKCPGADRVMSDRVITPRAVVDVEKLDDLLLALMIISPIDDLINEIVDKLRQCVKFASESWGPAASMVGYFEYTMPQTCVRREAYMFDMFTYMHTNGFVVDRAQHPRFAASAPLGTLPLHQYQLPAPT